MEELPTPQGEFHHFQLVNAEGEVPLSISVLVHYNRPSFGTEHVLNPISTDDVIEVHEALQSFDGDYIAAFRNT